MKPLRPVITAGVCALSCLVAGLVAAPAGTGDVVKAYAMAIVLDDLKTRTGVDSFPKSVSGLDIRQRAEALLFLSELRLAHTLN